MKLREQPESYATHLLPAVENYKLDHFWKKLWTPFNSSYWYRKNSKYLTTITNFKINTKKYTITVKHSIAMRINIPLESHTLKNSYISLFKKKVTIHKENENQKTIKHKTSKMIHLKVVTQIY